MMTITVEEAKQDLDAVLAHADQGGSVILLGDDVKAYQLIATIVPKKGARKAGLFNGQIKITDEFYEPLPEFKPYIE